MRRPPAITSSRAPSSPRTWVVTASRLPGSVAIEWKSTSVAASIAVCSSGVPPDADTRYRLSRQTANRMVLSGCQSAAITRPDAGTLQTVKSAPPDAGIVLRLASTLTPIVRLSGDQKTVLADGGIAARSLAIPESSACT